MTGLSVTNPLSRECRPAPVKTRCFCSDLIWVVIQVSLTLSAQSVHLHARGQLLPHVVQHAVSPPELCQGLGVFGLGSQLTTGP